MPHRALVIYIVRNARKDFIASGYQRTINMTMCHQLLSDSDLCMLDIDADCIGGDSDSSFMLLDILESLDDLPQPFTRMCLCVEVSE